MVIIAPEQCDDASQVLFNDKIGHVSGFRTSLSHDAAIRSKYRELARTRCVPLWPLYLWWAAVITTGASLLA